MCDPVEGGLGPEVPPRQQQTHHTEHKAFFDHQAYKGNFLSLTRLWFCEGNGEDPSHWQQCEKTHCQWESAALLVVTNVKRLKQTTRKQRACGEKQRNDCRGGILYGSNPGAEHIHESQRPHTWPAGHDDPPMSPWCSVPYKQNLDHQGIGR